MRELRITTSSFATDTDSNDCFLSPDDPIHQVKAAGILGTLTPAAIDTAYANKKRQEIADQHFKLRDEAKALGIRPGSPAWFALNQSK